MGKATDIVNDWRRTWYSGGKCLSIKDCVTLKETVAVAIEKAHAPSVQHALKTGGVSTKLPRRVVADYLALEIERMFQKQNVTQDEYDNWVKAACKVIRKIYRDHGISDYTYGNAQKLLNMTVKYTFSADNVDPTLPIFKVAHIPVDRVIMNISKKKLGVERMPKSWSKTDDMAEITSYEERFRQALPEGYFPLLWECENWKQ